MFLTWKLDDRGGVTGDQTHFATEIDETNSSTNLDDIPVCTTDAAGRVPSAALNCRLSTAFTMLMLSKLHHILSRVLDLPDLHTAVLLTVTGELVSYASYPGRPKDEIRVVTGLATEIWQETREQGYGMVESEKFGRIAVLPIDDDVGKGGKAEEEDGEGFSDERQPLMLLALNATDAVEWDELQEKGTVVAAHLAKPLSRFRDHLKVKPAPPTPSILSPTLGRNH